MIFRQPRISKSVGYAGAYDFSLSAFFKILHHASNSANLLIGKQIPQENNPLHHALPFAQRAPIFDTGCWLKWFTIFRSRNPGALCVTHLCCSSCRKILPPMKHLYPQRQPAPHIVRRGCIRCGGRPRQARPAGHAATATAACPAGLLFPCSSPSYSRAAAADDILPPASGPLFRSLIQASSPSSLATGAAARAPRRGHFVPKSRDSYHARERHLLVDVDETRVE